MPDAPAPELGGLLRQQLGLLTEDEVAAIAEVEVRTVRSWREQRAGPPWVKLGRTVLYRRDGLLAWLAENEVATLDAPQPAPRRARPGAGRSDAGSASRGAR